MENEEIIQFAKRMSQDILNQGKEIMPMCLIFEKDGNIEIIGMSFDENSKEKMRTELKNYIVNKSLEKYAVIFDAKMTSMDKKEKEKPKVIDAVFISIYSAKEKFAKSFPYYEDKKLIEDDEHSLIMNDRKGVHDSWDIWGEEMPIDHKENLKYQKLKRDNRGLYKGLDKKEDECHELKTKGKLEVIKLPLKFRIEIYRSQGKAMFESFNAKNEIFFATTVVEDNEDFQNKINHIKNILIKLGNKFKKRFE